MGEVRDLSASLMQVTIPRSSDGARARALGPQIWAKAGWDEDNGPPGALVTHCVAASLKSKIISEGTRYACMSQMVHHRRPVVLLLVLGETSEEDVDEQGEGVDMVTS